MTEDDVRALLRKKTAGRKAVHWARENGVSQSYLSEFMSGSKGVGPQIIDALGLEVVYRRKRKTT